MMQRFFGSCQRYYDDWILGKPRGVLCSLLILLGFLVVYVPDFRLDATSDSLLLEGDKDLESFRKLSARYAVQDFLFLAITPNQPLFIEATISWINSLREELIRLPQVDSVISLLDVPLVQQKASSLSNLADNFRTLQAPDVDLERARKELLNSPTYRNLIISPDGLTTAMQINLKTDAVFAKLQARKNELQKKKRTGKLIKQEKQQLKTVLAEYVERKQYLDKKNNENILSVREIISRYQDFGQLSLGGVPMIANDMIGFIKGDLLYFGMGLFLFLVGMLWTIFRMFRWVLLPLASCVYASTVMLGFLAAVGWPVTVISSNFISLMLIITMSMNIHLIVRYRQLRVDNTELSQRQLVLMMASKMIWPCLYTILTTIIAFFSFVISGIKPVIDFGYMMVMGLVVIFFTSFLLFPSLLVLLPKTKIVSDKKNITLTRILAVITDRYGAAVIAGAILLVAVSIYGVMRLEVENSFINYFSKDTEIYQGLALIDRQLGGSIPLDIIISFADELEELDAEDDFDMVFSDEEDEEDLEVAWFTTNKIDTIKKVHDYLDALPAVGKVFSLASIVRVGEDINNGEFNAFELALISKRMPTSLKEAMINPYISIAENEARISARILDSLPDLNRKELLETIKHDLTKKLGIPEDRIQLNGLLVLYNNMLQSLFDSQIVTLGFVMLGIAFMLLILFRSVVLAVIGIIPNILAAAIILGLMGWLNIPLDMMTITIAAITIGIAVDNSIHYIYRFKEEFSVERGYIKTLYYCHASIGMAVFYTAITIIVGFSILVLSNFIPTIYFGLLTALAMAIALIAALTLLPKLILFSKPF